MGRADREEQAKALCNGCRLKDPCLEFALINREEWGVWGGMTEGERRAFRQWCAKWGVDVVPEREVLKLLLVGFWADFRPELPC